MRLVKLWIWVSALASLAGWTLSALGMLNKSGYVIFAGIVVVVVLLLGKRPLFQSLSPVPDLRKWRHRIRRFLPASFAFLAALIFVSGLIYAPDNHTGLSYRLPRVLQWLQHGHWIWIHTPNYRMNDRACGIEWMTAPMLLFLRSDRGLFLLNFIPFVLMPGLIFSVWTRLGVRPRVAWNWMWLVPTGYCFLIQAGGIANDTFPTVYFLAMMDFALRAWEKMRRAKPGCGGPGLTLNSQSSILAPVCSDLGLSLLSAALLVGAKASNLPLGLPWAIVFFPAVVGAVRLGRKRACEFDGAAGGVTGTRSIFRFLIFDFSRWAFIFLIALVISFLPTAILNYHYLHDWSGLSIEHSGMKMKNPLAGVLGNSVLLFTENFVPTFFPMAGWWNQHALAHFPGPLVRMMNANFEEGYNVLGEMPIEDACGIGFGICVLIVASVLAGLKYRNRSKAVGRENDRPALLLRVALIAPWISLLFYTMVTGMDTPARLIAPYYPLLFPALLVGAGQSKVVRRRWWRIFAGGSVALALAALVADPARPLWPAQTILARLVAKHPRQQQLLRAQEVYRVYATRPDPLAGVRGWFPPGLKVIGFMGTGDDLDISLWKPYGSRRVEPFLVDDPPEKIRALGLEYAIVGGFNLQYEKKSLADWLKKSNAEIIATTNATMTVIQGPQPWYLVRFKK